MKIHIDERWDEVSGRIGRPEGWVPDDRNVSDLIEVLIEVQYDGQIFYSKQIVDDDSLKDVQFNLMNWLLDEMVAKIDGYINYWEEHGVHIESS